MTYTEMQQAEAEYLRAIQPKKQRGATKAQLEYRARVLRAAAIAQAIRANVADFWARRVTYEAFAQKQRVLWCKAEHAGVDDAVCGALR